MVLAVTGFVLGGKFEDLKNHKQFYFFNVHYEYEGDVARRESSNLMISRIKSIAGNQPVFLTGDFNAFPTEEPIRILNDSGFLNDSYKDHQGSPVRSGLYLSRI